MEDWESDSIVDQWVRENDRTNMPLPAIESNPHLLISKVRKHYMEYLIKLLSTNYENNQKLLNKNIYLPSAIWRCAKKIEMSAAQSCMVVQLYRKNITNIVKDLKKSTQKGSLFKNLYECLHYAPENEKKTQATSISECNCKCSCNQKRKIKRTKSPNQNLTKVVDGIKNNVTSTDIDDNMSHTLSNPLLNQVTQMEPDSSVVSNPLKLNEKMALELQNSDELMQRLEKLFQGDSIDEDLFDGALCESYNPTVIDEKGKSSYNKSKPVNITIQPEAQSGYVEYQKQCLDERLKLLSGVLVNNIETSTQDPGGNQSKKTRISKWLCEEYFQKVKLFELLDQIRECDRNKLIRVKNMLLELFGDDSDDECVVSPLEESPDFVISCKERIAPWVVEILTPYYVKGRIRGKTLFKSLAKHLIRLIYQCSKYPYEYEVQSFVKDFLNNHKMIRCEADFKQFRIENV